MTAPVLTSLPFLPQINASPDIVTKLTEFELGMLKMYMGLQPPTLIQMGMRQTTSSLAYKMPVSVGSSVFKELTGGTQYRKVGKLLLSVSTLAYGDGVMAEALELQSDDWKGWGDQPASMGVAANLIGEKALVTAIEAGESTASIENYIDGDTGSTSINFHGQNKSVDPFGLSSSKYSNLFTGAGTAGLSNLDAAAPMNLSNVDRVWGYLHSIPSTDGTHFRDLEWVGVLVPRPLELLARRIFEDQGSANDMINVALDDAKFMQPNTAKRYGIKVFSSPYLSSSTTWYPICRSTTQSMAPWVELTQVPARQVEFAGAMQSSPQNSNGAGDLIWVVDDYTSEGYKHGTPSIPQGHVALKAMKRVGVALTDPFRLFKCKAT